MRHTQAPKVEVALIDRPGTVAWGAGEPMAWAIPAAIANAVFDATGARMRFGFRLRRTKSRRPWLEFKRKGVKASQCGCELFAVERAAPTAHESLNC